MNVSRARNRLEAFAAGCLASAGSGSVTALQRSQVLMWWLVFRAVVIGGTVVVVSEMAARFPRMGALVLTLPIVSVTALVVTWTKTHDTFTIARLAKETLVLVPLGLPLFIPLAFADRWGLGFWQALAAGVLLASILVGLWFRFGPTVT